MKPSIEDIRHLYKPKVKPIEWNHNGHLILLDQSKLPFETTYVTLTTPEATADAIRTMKVRGAPAIGITAAYGMVLALFNGSLSTLNDALEALRKAKVVLDAARPTAVNLAWATNRMVKKAMDLSNNGDAKTPAQLRELLIKEAEAIFDEEYNAEIAMGLYGLEKINEGDTILTQCNAGGLATGTGLGTATAPIKIAHALGIEVSMIAPETRPWLQGARLTVYELMVEGIQTTLITDTAVGLVMYKGMVNSVMVGADRILRDGHVFNKIGTMKEAIIAHEFGIPFYALAPSSTFDMKSKVDEVIIEERDPDEVRKIRGVPITVEGVPVYNPVFDPTPPKYVTGIITEKGIIYPPFARNIPRMIGE
ncbi:S-methyl-5-thioribose-1-phosphate isomerase [Thermocladium modestius]|uniref:Putative methylthioribose-1-phosphate isomerase n=1 Tax=Thermocladium modestius TaxID=62609 RepID=A0A830GVI9_9CREN|nr:S-methyl-5-thioribose-1-phosphate isomerase [Thermocladium modestius]GGP20414.1 S-methyl-5-thioribose-1-phosphate isomerase [Thermocladium modestius]